MELYWKAAAAVLLAVVMILALRRQELGILLAMAACVMVALAALEYLKPVMELVESMKELGDMDGDVLHILMKTVGIGVVTEIAGMICADCGNSSMGKSLELLGTAVILWLSVPLFTALLELIRGILEGI